MHTVASTDEPARSDAAHRQGAERTLPEGATQEELEAHLRAHEEVARKLRAHGVTYEQLCEEALEIVREIREGRYRERQGRQ